jgi:hypothetical protein
MQELQQQLAAQSEELHSCRADVEQQLRKMEEMLAGSSALPAALEEMVRDREQQAERQARREQHNQVGGLQVLASSVAGRQVAG